MSSSVDIAQNLGETTTWTGRFNLFFIFFDLSCQLVSVGLLASALRARFSWAGTVLIAATFAFMAADADYNIRMWFGYHVPGWIRHLGEISYTVAFLLLLVFISLHSAIFSRKKVDFCLAALLVFVSSLVLQITYVVRPLETSSLSAVATTRINYLIYTVVTAACAGLAVPLSLVTMSLRTHLYAQSLLGLMVADFSLRYHNAQVDFGFHVIAEAGWGASMAAGAWALRRGSGSDWWRRPSAQARTESLRVMVGVMVFGAIFIVVIAKLLLGLIFLHNAFHLSATLAVVWLAWLASNVVALRVSQSLLAIEDLMPSAHPGRSSNVAAGDQYLASISQRAGLEEWDRMIGKYNTLVERTNSIWSELMTKNREAALAGLAAQVAHDIRSPIAALQVVSEHLLGTEEGMRSLFRQALQRVDDIANDLLRRSRSRQQMPYAAQSILVCERAATIASEKRVQLRPLLDVRINLVHPPCADFVSADAIVLGRVLSNLLDNAVEAVETKGDISVSVEREGAFIKCSISDTGVGMSEELVARLGRRGITLMLPPKSGRLRLVNGLPTAPDQLVVCRA